MLSVQRMTPFYTKQEDFRLRLVFAYQYFSIVKGGEVFQFVPSEGKEIIVNKNNLQVENLGEVFVFQRGNRFIRLPLYQLLLISDLHMHLNTILEGSIDMEVKIEVPEDVALAAQELIDVLESENRLRMIDYALETKNVTLFKKLTKTLQKT